MPVVDRREIGRPGAAAVVLPEVIVAAGPAAVERFLEFFAAAIANDRTRAAYGRAVGQFLAWCGARGLGLRAIAPLHVAAYIRTHPGSAPTVKQHLAAKRRAAAAGLPATTCCHTFRATGITAYLSNGGTLEHAQRIAGHASPKTTKLYDRPADTITLDEIERIVI